ncbi:MAG: hypothetical protein NVSMB9_30840 [Isosphaeraceae bacterium]
MTFARSQPHRTTAIRTWGTSLITGVGPELLESDLREARKYLPGGDPADQEAFARRQLRARERLTRLLAFYRVNPCRMARTQLLAACAITLGRFCGYSRAFDAIGAALMPFDDGGQPRTEAWREYVEACAAGRPWAIREECWLSAYMQDIQGVCASGLDADFHAESVAQAHDPTWRLLQRHMEVTVGARVIDSSALAGAVAYETAMSRTMARGVSRLFTAGWSLLAYYAAEAAQALLSLNSESSRPLVSYRRCALGLLQYTATAWAASGIYRRGIRQRDRGRIASDEGWPLLARVLGERVHEVHPLVVRFYTNPAPFDVKASLKLNTIPAKAWSRLATLCMGQGLYESDLVEIDARFRVFRRADGSMHFVRELYCGGAFRVFDSDFIVRETPRGPALFEVFADLGVDVEMEVTPLPDGGLSIRGRDVYLRGIRVPSFGLRVEFRSRVVRTAEDVEALEIDGHLLMQPRTVLGRALAYRLLRRPEQLGSIHYTARPTRSGARELGAPVESTADSPAVSVSQVTRSHDHEK